AASLGLPAASRSPWATGSTSRYLPRHLRAFASAWSAHDGVRAGARSLASTGCVVGWGLPPSRCGGGSDLSVVPETVSREMSSGQLVEPLLGLPQARTQSRISLARLVKSHHAGDVLEARTAQQLSDVQEQLIAPVLGRPSRRAKEPAQCFATPARSCREAAKVPVQRDPVQRTAVPALD